MDKIPIYCYTINYKNGNIRERRGNIVGIFHYGRNLLFREDGDKRIWTLNGLGIKEGAVYGPNVWFFEQNYEGAKQAFIEAGRLIGESYICKSKRSIERSEVIK